MSHSSEIQNLTNNVGSPESSISSSPSLPQRTYYRFTKFYNKSSAHEPPSYIVGPCATSKSKLLSCFTPQCLRRRMENMSCKCKSRENDVVGCEDHQQHPGMIYHDSSSCRLKMEVLKREVDKLENQLAHVQNMNAVLKYAHQLETGRAISIPSFIPLEVRELLLEMGEVNEEISRLERKISELQEVTGSLKSKTMRKDELKFSVSKSGVRNENAHRKGSETVKSGLRKSENLSQGKTRLPSLELGFNLRYN